MMGVRHQHVWDGLVDRGVHGVCVGAFDGRHTRDDRLELREVRLRGRHQAEVGEPVLQARPECVFGAVHDLGYGATTDRGADVVRARTRHRGRDRSERGEVEEEVPERHRHEAVLRRDRTLRAELLVDPLHAEVDAARGDRPCERRDGARHHLADVAARVDVALVGARIELAHVARERRDRPRLKPRDLAALIDRPLEVERHAARVRDLHRGRHERA